MAVLRTMQGVLVFSISLGLSACFLQPATKTDETPPATKPTTQAVSTSKVRRPARSQDPRPLSVAVLDPQNLVEARSRHRQSLVTADNDALVGGDVGYYMDIQEARLLQLLANGGITIKREGNNITLSVPGGSMFGSNSFFLRSNMKQLLAPIADVLVEYEKTQIAIYGHTDDVGEENYNQQLSEKRAMSVARFLVDAGVTQRRIAVVGYGELQPIATNTTPEGRKTNRRVELQLVPVTQ